MRLFYLFCSILLALTAVKNQAYAMASKPPVEITHETKSPGVKRILTLEDAYELALRRSEAIAIAREEIAITRAQWLKATGEVIGDADLVITDFLQDELTDGGSGGGGVGGTLNATERRERTLVFSQPIFQGFRAWGALGGAGSLSKQRKQEHQRSKELLFLEVVDAFYGYLQQKKDVQTIEGVHELYQERIKELEEREEIGRSRTSEVVTARTRMKILEAELAQSRGALAIAEHLLEFYTGIPSEQADYQETEILPNQIEKPVDLKEMAESRADVEAAHQAAITARQSVIISQSELWPEITFDVTHYEHREGFQSGIDWDALFKINVPLYRGGTVIGDVKEKYSEWKQAKLNYSLVKRQAELEIKETYENWKAALEQSKSLEQAVKASQENYQLQKEEYTRNLVNNLEVLLALEELFNTSQDANHTHYLMKKNFWRFQTAVGDCCEIPSDAAAAPHEVSP